MLSESDKNHIDCMFGVYQINIEAYKRTVRCTPDMNMKKFNQMKKRIHMDFNYYDEVESHKDACEYIDFLMQDTYDYMMLFVKDGEYYNPNNIPKQNDKSLNIPKTDLLEGFVFYIIFMLCSLIFNYFWILWILWTFIYLNWAKKTIEDYNTKGGQDL